ncbi:MAG: ABC transporter substrate-binding protein [Pseudomonadota bacterium]
MGKRQKRIFFGLAVFLMVFGTVFILGSQCPAVASGAKLEQTKLSIGLPGTGASFLPNHLAEMKGWYKEEGITEVKILGFKGNANVVQALAAGTIDFCVASLHGLVNTMNSGQNFKGFWAGYNMTFFEWYTQPNKYKSIADAKGGRFGVSRYGSLTDSLTRYIIKKAGLDPEKDVKILQSGQNATILAALESGQLDVGILESLFSFSAREKGLQRLANQREDISRDYPTHVLYAKENVIAEKPNTIKAYLRATGKAMDWIKENPEEAAKILEKVYKFKLEYCRPTIDAISYGWHSDGRLPDAQGMKVFWDIAISIGDAKEPWPNSKWLDDRFVKTQDQWRK